MKLPKHRRDEAALNSRLIRRPIKRMVWLFLLPTFAAFCIGFLYPFFKGLFLSFCEFRITSQWTWTGLENYRKAFQDPGYMHAFWYTALFALVSLIAINLFAFTIAYALTQKFKGTNVFRTVFFLPNLIGGIVLGYIWSMIFDGILIKYNTSVVLETKYGFWGLVILVCWQQIGYMMIIYIAGLQAVPEDMLEAARIDGANRWQTLWRVTIPNVMPSITICMFLSLTNGFKRPSASSSFRPAAARRCSNDQNRSSAPQRAPSGAADGGVHHHLRDLSDAGAPGAHQLPEGQRLCQHRDLQAAHGGILCGAEELCQGHDLRQLRLL